MPRYVELSHVIENGMPGFRTTGLDGHPVEFSVHIRPMRTHAQSRPLYQDKAEFEITEMTLQTSIGTYVDAPYARFEKKRDVAGLRLEELILPGLVVDLTHLGPNQGAAAVDLERGAAGADMAGKAVLCRFGWDRFWGLEAYYAHPFLSREAVRRLIEAGARLVGVDTLNIDDAADLERPAHTWLLRQDILIVENLCNLGAVAGAAFRFFALPPCVRGAASMPVRAFAELPD
ncbi:MAG: cyclase family protein [Rhodospirillaceae bacterium]|nr:cyclase family protein [Rhodospirillaceae bacterium]